MLLTLLVALVGLGCAWLRRDSGRSGSIELLWWPLLIVALICRLVAAVADGNLAVFAEVSMLTAILWFCLRNVTITGLSIVALGVTANLVVAAINEGTPVRPSAAVSAGLLDEGQLTTSDFGGSRHLETAEDRLSFLGDNIPIGLTNQVLSFGDLILLAGVGNVIFSAGATMFTRRRDEASEASRPQVLEPEASGEAWPIDSRWSRSSIEGETVEPGEDDEQEQRQEEAPEVVTANAEPIDADSSTERVIDIDELERTSAASSTGSTEAEVVDAEVAGAGFAQEGSGAAEAGDGELETERKEIDLRPRTLSKAVPTERPDGEINLDDSAPAVDPQVAAAFNYGNTPGHESDSGPGTGPTASSASDSGATDSSAGPYQVRVVESATIAAAFKWDEPATDLELINASDIDSGSAKRRDGGLGWPAQPATRSEPDPAKQATTGELPRANAAEEARLDAAFGPLMNSTDANVVPLMANEGRPPLVVRAPQAGGLAPAPKPAKADAFDGLDVVVIKSRFSLARPTPSTPPSATGTQATQPGPSDAAPMAMPAQATRPTPPQKSPSPTRVANIAASEKAVSAEALSEEALSESESSEPAVAASPTETGEDNNVIELDRARRADRLSELAVVGPLIPAAEAEGGVLATSDQPAEDELVLDLTDDAAVSGSGRDRSDSETGSVIHLGQGSARAASETASPLANSLAQTREPSPVDEKPEGH